MDARVRDLDVELRQHSNGVLADRNELISGAKVKPSARI